MSRNVQTHTRPNRRQIEGSVTQPLTPSFAICGRGRSARDIHARTIPKDLYLCVCVCVGVDSSEHGLLLSRAGGGVRTWEYSKTA